MTKRGGATLMKMFDEPMFAWDLLEWEMAIQMNESVSGKAIAKLLELYMRGVEKMNSLVDIRQTYFKNKVTSLMMRGNVVKTLNKPPMAKKTKPLETSAKMEDKIKIKAKDKIKTERSNEELLPHIHSASSINPYSLQQKRRQIQMRLAFQSHEHSRQNLGKIYSQHLIKEEHMEYKIAAVLNDHEMKLQERINLRKLKTVTMRSRPDNTNDTSTKQKDQIDELRSKEDAFVHGTNSHFNENKSISKRKLMKSVESLTNYNRECSVKIKRRYTFDDTDLGPQKDVILISTINKAKRCLQLNQAQ